MKEYKNVLLFLLIIILLVIAMLVYLKDLNNDDWTLKPLPKKLNLNQEFALRAWRDILNVRVSEKDERLEKIKAENKIHLLVELLAARIKTGKENFKDVLVSNKDIKKALSLLNETSPVAIDMFVGDWDGDCSVSELNEFINYEKTHFQVGIIREMTITYYPF